MNHSHQIHKNISKQPFHHHDLSKINKNDKRHHSNSVNLQRHTSTPQPKNTNIRFKYQFHNKSNITKQNSKLIKDDFQVYLDHTVKELTLKKQKLQQYIRIFNLMQTHSQQVRCLQHSNTLTIYCQTQRKCLCANCVYGFTRHRTHKLVPLKDAHIHIIDDNNELWQQINLDLKKMDQSIKVSQDNTIRLQRQLKCIIKKQQQQHMQKIELIKARYNEKKQKTTQLYQGLLQRSRWVQKTVEQFKVKVWQILSKIGIGKKIQNNNTDIQVSKQVICSSLAVITNINIKDICQKQLQKIAHKLTKF